MKLGPHLLALVSGVAMSACGARQVETGLPSDTSGSDDAGTLGGTTSPGATTATSPGEGTANDESGSSTGDGDDADGSGGTDPSASTDASDEDDSDDCGGFLGCGDQPPVVEMCDFWAQDCPAGSKCIPVSTVPGSGAWNTDVCVPIDDAPVGLFEPCTFREDPFDDNCEATARCVDIDAATGVGVCKEMCVGPENMATCPRSGLTCRKLASGTLKICDGTCTPLLAGGCPTGQDCVAAFAGTEISGFVCLPPGTAQPGGGGDECACANCCQAGHFCVTPEDYGAGCSFDLCCTEYCDINDTSFTCAQPDQTCVALFDPTTPQIGNVGACLAPASP